MNFQKISYWALRIIPAIIFLQTLFFKFTAAPETIYIFEKLGAEPIGRIASGVMELIAALLLLNPKTTWLGATLGIGVIGGAILSHLTILGIEVQGDGGTLFGMAILVFVCCAILVWQLRKEIPILKNMF